MIDEKKDKICRDIPSYSYTNKRGTLVKVRAHQRCYKRKELTEAEKAKIEEAKREIEALEEEQEQLDTLEKYYQNGIWDRERERLHDEIERDIFNGDFLKGDIVYLTGGAPANGKSTLLESGLVDIPDNILEINADRIKEYLPEYKRGIENRNPYAAKIVHEESSFLSKKFIERAMNEQYAVVLDGVGNGSPEKLKAKTDSYREKGYKIIAYYVNLDTDLSLELNEDRFKRTGRFVPPEYVKEMNSSIPKYFRTYTESDNFDEAYLYDTNIQGEPRLMAEYKNKNFSVINKILFRIFTSYE